MVLTKVGFGATVSQSELVVDPMTQFKLVQFHRVDTATSVDTVFRRVEEHVFGQSERRAGMSRYRGHSVWLLAGEDRLTISWSGATIPSDSKSPDTIVDTGSIVITGGSGRFARAQGGGSYRGFASGKVLERITLDIRY
ncbi:MAG: hypothetical protein ABMA00_13155 [Gemmatimonas sp.]